MMRRHYTNICAAEKGCTIIEPSEKTDPVSDTAALRQNTQSAFPLTLPGEEQYGIFDTHKCLNKRIEPFPGIKTSECANNGPSGLDSKVINRPAGFLEWLSKVADHADAIRRPAICNTFLHNAGRVADQVIATSVILDGVIAAQSADIDVITSRQPTSCSVHPCHDDIGVKRFAELCNSISVDNSSQPAWNEDFVAQTRSLDVTN